VPKPPAWPEVAVADIKNLVASLKAALRQTGADYGSALQQLEALKRERENVALARTHRSDILALLSKRVDEDIERYWRAVDAGFLILAGSGPERAAKSLGPEGWPPPQHPRFLAGFTIDNRDGQPEAVERHVASAPALLAWIGADAVKHALAERLKSLEIPDEGLPAVERTRKLAALDAKIEQLEADLDEMRRAAEAAGLRIIPTELPAPAPPPPPALGQRHELPVQTFPGSKPAGLDISVTYGGASHD
jgi:hypothetical protein